MINNKNYKLKIYNLSTIFREFLCNHCIYWQQCDQNTQPNQRIGAEQIDQQTHDNHQRHWRNQAQIKPLCVNNNNNNNDNKNIIPLMNNNIFIFFLKKKQITIEKFQLIFEHHYSSM